MEKFIFLVRHGSSSEESGGLTEDGKTEMRELAQFIRDTAPPSPILIIASHLPRGQESAAIIHDMLADRPPTINLATDIVRGDAPELVRFFNFIVGLDEMPDLGQPEEWLGKPCGTAIVIGHRANGMLEILRCLLNVRHAVARMKGCDVDSVDMEQVYAIADSDALVDYVGDEPAQTFEMARLVGFRAASWENCRNNAMPWVDKLFSVNAPPAVSRGGSTILSQPSP